MPKNNSFAKKLLIVWLAAFSILSILLYSAMLVGSGLLFLGGAGRAVEALIQDSLAFIIVVPLLISAVLSLVVTLISSIVIWVFQTESIAAVHKKLGDEKSNAPAYLSTELDWKKILSPTTGLGALVVSFMVLGYYTYHPSSTYQYWHWLAFALPLIALICAGYGLTQLVIDFRWRASLLPKAGWRLRVVLSVLSIGWLISTVTTNFTACSKDELLGIVKVQNVTGLQYYLATHQQCKVGSQDNTEHPSIRAVFKEVFESNIRQYTIQTNVHDKAKFNYNKFNMIGQLHEFGATMHEYYWADVLETYDENELRMLLAALKIDSTDAPAFPFDILKSALIAENYDEKYYVAKLNRLMSGGLHIGQESGLKLIDEALSKVKPSWKLFDALVQAGVVLPSQMHDLITAIRTRNITPVIAWNQADWHQSADKKVWINYSYSFLDMAMQYADDIKIRDEILALAETSPSQYLKAQRLPYRCSLRRFKVSEIRTSMLDEPKGDSGKYQCEDMYLPALEYEQKTAI